MKSLTKGLKGKCSVCYDDTPECIVKQCTQLTKQKTLTHIYNISLNSGVLSNESKIAKAKPLYKKGDRYDIQNYRPISVLSIFFKLLERFMFNRLKHFISINRIVTEAQNSFEKGNVLKQQFNYLQKI
jgi:hypothetical protein